MTTIDPGLVPTAALGRPEAHSSAAASEAGLGRHALAVLDCLAHGVVLVDHLGRIRWRNAAAAAILSRRDGLVTRGDTLQATSAPAEGVRLRQLIGGASAGEHRIADVMTVSRASGRPLQILVAPLPAEPEGRPAAFATVPSAVVFTTDPDDRPTAPAGALARLFGLTWAEAQLAAALAAGTRAKEYAAARRLPLARVRRLLRHVQARRGARHRADLVRVLNDQTGAFGPTLRALDLGVVTEQQQPVA